MGKGRCRGIELPIDVSDLNFNTGSATLSTTQRDLVEQGGSVESSSVHIDTLLYLRMAWHCTMERCEECLSTNICTYRG